MSSLSPLTTRSPRLTRVSEGNPFRRLLVASKPELVEVFGLGFHGTPPLRNTPRIGEADYSKVARRFANFSLGTLLSNVEGNRLAVVLGFIASQLQHQSRGRVTWILSEFLACS